MEELLSDSWILEGKRDSPEGKLDAVERCYELRWRSCRAGRDARGEAEQRTARAANFPFVDEKFP